MPWFPEDAAIPGGYTAAEYRLRMLSTADVELDYAAVIASREQLLLKSLGTWPRPGFTIAENYADLDEHQRDHLNRANFTYTIMNLAETECLGCIYITPLAPTLAKMTSYAQLSEDRRDPEQEARVWYWVRPERIAVGLDQQLIAHLIAWFAIEWPFENVVFQAHAGESQQLGVLEAAGLTPIYRLESPNNPEPIWLYGEIGY